MKCIKILCICGCCSLQKFKGIFFFNFKRTFPLFPVASTNQNFQIKSFCGVTSKILIFYIKNKTLIFFFKYIFINHLKMVYLFLFIYFIKRHLDILSSFARTNVFLHIFYKKCHSHFCHMFFRKCCCFF